MAKIGTSGSRKLEYSGGLASHVDNLLPKISCSEEGCQQAERKSEVGKAGDYNKLVVSYDALMSKQVNVMNTNNGEVFVNMIIYNRLWLSQIHGINESNSKNVNVRLNNISADETCVRSLRKLSKKGCTTTLAENKERNEQNVKESTNRQKFLKLCNIKSQGDDPHRLGVISFAQAMIKPINYKQMQELSFRDLISTNVDNISYSSEDNSPLTNRRYSDNEDKNASKIYPLISTRWSCCDRIIDTIEEEPLLLHSAVCGSSSSTSATEYDPNLIANFDPNCNARKTVMEFNGYVSIIMQYQPENELKRLVNEEFRLRFPHVHVSFSKIRSIKRELHQIAVACNLEDVTTAHAYVFYEKALLKGLVCKMNRKLVAGAALLIAAKITDFGSMSVSDVVNYLESSLRINRKELLRYEIPLCAALSFNLKVPVWQLLPHYQRIALTIL
ncbi:unnamed protein product [Onchocerca ochengi]|uniref:CYCLIN domain-containing protein n=1 Tax=Onchocerca ochengi TaxID=42157 RepID=A0A182EIC8_ONCOC|nr:unnamed protein product [Onchocerca ochengi]